ncbi:MAG: SUMF1/EgtB/PvdO family nonheme iron enzyme [Chloroflexaceae bacterium]|nr:SUMF1/EgtB/PvdO family nonheme iron enzyme [Chloroflexaceae bacterium]
MIIRLSRCASFPAFRRQTLDEFSDEQMSQFVTMWYTELAHSGRRTPPQARDDATALTDAIATRPDLRDLARLPLLATVMTLVHTNRGTMPDARALLYYECIDILLLRWRQQRGEGDLLARLNLPDFRSDNLLALMARLGFLAHEQSERSTDEHAASSTDLGEQQVIGILAEGFAHYDENRKYELAHTVLQALAHGNGLLLQRGPGVYAFPHRTFQEFLAGYHLLRQPNYTLQCLHRSERVHWHEALLLMVGYQVLAGGEYDKPLGLAEKLIERSPDEQILAGKILELMGRERVVAYNLFGQEGIWRRVYRALRKLSIMNGPIMAPAMVRVRAGLLAGRLTSYDNTEVVQPIFDPRLPLALINSRWENTIDWHKALSYYWCQVPAGEFWYGEEQSDLEHAYLLCSFHIARFPISNADFARFVNTGGYHNEEWWTPGGWEWRLRTDERHPERILQYKEFANPLQPVTLVTWYEAAAYCIWLTHHGTPKAGSPKMKRSACPHRWNGNGPHAAAINAPTVGLARANARVCQLQRNGHRADLAHRLLSKGGGPVRRSRDGWQRAGMAGDTLE